MTQDEIIREIPWESINSFMYWVSDSFPAVSESDFQKAVSAKDPAIFCFKINGKPIVAQCSEVQKGLCGRLTSASDFFGMVDRAAEAFQK